MLAENPELAAKEAEEAKQEGRESIDNNEKKDDDLEPLRMADSDDSNSQTSLEKEHQLQQQQAIEENNLLGDHFFDVKSEHCLQPLLPQ